MGSVLETLNQGVVISDEDRRIVFANSMFLEMSKMLAEEVLGRSVMDLYPPDDVGRLQEFIARREAQGRARYEFYVPQADGGRLPVAVTSCLVHGGDGRAYGVVTATDISDQKRAIGGSARPFFRGFFARSSTRCEHKFSKDAKAETLVFRSLSLSVLTPLADIHGALQNEPMLWEGRPLRDIRDADIRRLIESGLAEHLQLEYKSALYEDNDRGRREFLLDICMFANSSGGILLVGIPERRDE